MAEMTNTPHLFTQSLMVERIKACFANLPDPRSGTGPYQKYSMADAALSAFSVFFMQAPSFLEYQRLMEKSRGQSNAQSLFGVHQIPSDNQIRNLLDGVPPETLQPLFRALYQDLEPLEAFQDFRVFEGSVLVAFDGVEYFRSTKLHCDHCLQQTRANGTIEYHHGAVTPVLVSPHSSAVIPLAPEFIQPQDGAEKQDHERAAAQRWMAREGDDLRGPVTVLGDDLYSRQPFCEPVLARGWHFIFVCKPESHPTLTEWVADLERTGHVETLIRHRWTGQQRLTERYRWVSHVPLRNTDDALMVQWCEVEITDQHGHRVYHNAWVTDYAITAHTVVALVQAGRTRWKIENENNNTLKTKGYHFEHNFGHGKAHLSALLASLMILAFLVHTLLELFDAYYRALRETLVSRQTFFNDIRALIRYAYFESWHHLMVFMLEALEIPLPDT